LSRGWRGWNPPPNQGAEMARFLFVVPPFAGHVNPTVPVAAELVQWGHEVAWTGLPGSVEALLPDDAPFWAATSPEVAAYVADAGARRPDMRGAAAFKFLQEAVLLPLAAAMVDGVDAAVEAFEPDIMIVDQQALAGAVVARRRGMVWATSATTSGELVDPLAGLPLVATAMHRARVDLQIAHGVDPSVAALGDLRISPHLVVAYTTEALAGDVAIAAPVAFVGPSTLGRPEIDDFPWDQLDDSRPKVLISLGTLNADAGERFFAVAAEACRDQPWQAIFVAPEAMVPHPPSGAIVRARVPQLAVLARVDAVVSHGGHNTVCESLAAGLPLVLAPIRDDQPVVADQVVRAGAGVRVKFNRVKAPDLRSAILQALTDPELRRSAAVVAASFAVAGGAQAAAEALVGLVPASGDGARPVGRPVQSRRS
ncbi:MAG: nucleotide disphospho-sugar-binding domain-containing protein, partial [Aquihabitans sp.]